MNKFKWNTTSFLIIVLLASFISVIYLNIASLADDQSAYANFKDTNVHFHGENMRYSSSGTSYTTQDVDFPNLDLSQNFHSPLFNKKVPFHMNSIRPSIYYLTKSTDQNSQVQLQSSISPVNFINSVYQNNEQTSNSSLIFNSFNKQAFTLKLFPGKRIKSHSLINSQFDTTHQNTEFHDLNSIPAFKSKNSFVNYYGVQNDFIDPGDPPDGDEIPVPNGTYFLLILSAIYACWKIKNVRE
jgi:hypothetical protein